MAARILPFVYGILARPQHIPLVVRGGEPISSDALNPFVAHRRTSLSAPRTSVLAARVLWALSEGKIWVSYLPSGERPKIMVSVLAGGTSVRTGGRASGADVERILLDIEAGGIYNDHEAHQSPASVALFAALDLYDRRRGLDFAPAYLALLRAKEAGSPSAIRDALLAATDELLVSLLNDYETDHNSSPVSWHLSPSGQIFAKMSSERALDLSTLVTEAPALDAHRPDMERYLARRAVFPVITPVLDLNPDTTPSEQILDLERLEGQELLRVATPSPVEISIPEPVAAGDPADAALLCVELGLSKVAATMLVSRGFTSSEAASQYLRPRGVESHDPYDMKGMFACAARLHRAIKSKEKIVIFGDYDADGITGTSLLLTYLRSVTLDGAPPVVAVIPEREAGYGLLMPAAQGIREEHAPDLVITVDCGSSNHEEIVYLRGAGIDVLVTDHHLTLKGAPPTPYFINPNRSDGDDYLFHGLCGAGVAYKLVQAIAKPSSGELFAHVPEFYDFIMIGTVADRVALGGENRFYVRDGLERINRRSRGNIGLWAIAAQAERSGVFLEKLDSEQLGFDIAPRINAMGRMGQHPILAMELLTTSDHNRAAELATLLEKTNTERKALGARLFEQAQAQLGPDPSDEVLGVYLEEMTGGVTGWVANKLCDYYHKPVLVVTPRGAGSGRAPEGQAVMPYMERLRAMGIFGVPRLGSDGTTIIPDYGGHAAALGFGGVEIEPFLAAVKSLHALAPADESFAHVDATITLDDITPQLDAEMKSMGPYGQDNPTPVFALEDLEIANVRTSKSGNTLLFAVRQGEREVKAHWFGHGSIDLASLPVRVDIRANLARGFSGDLELNIRALGAATAQ